MADSSSELAAALSRYLSARTASVVAVREMEHLSLGWESDVYGFRADGWRDDGPRVLRLYFGGGAARAALREVQALRLLADVGYPVPAVDMVEPSPGPLGRTFLVMQRIAGGPLWESLAQLAPDAQIKAVEELGALLARLHQVDLARLPATWPVRASDVGAQLGHMASMIAAFPIEDTRLALTWLQDRAAAYDPPELGLVHWDFHPNNVLQDGDGKRWVIDWTQFQATDVRFDLTWTLLLVGGYAGQPWADTLLAGYAAAWPTPPVWLHDLSYFEAAACAKRVVSVVISLLAGPDKLGMRPGAEETMRGHLPVMGRIYRRWLTLTGVALPKTEQLLAAHL